MCQVVRVHVTGQRLHHVQRGNAIGVVDRRRSRSGLKERTTMAKIHVHEFLGEVPAGLICAADWMFHQTLGLDGFCGREDLLIGRWHANTGGIENILAIEQVLCVCHEGNRHHLAVDGDLLHALKVATMLGNHIIKRHGQPVIHQRHECAVGHVGGGKFWRARREASDDQILVILVQVCGDAGTTTVAGCGSRSHGLKRRKIIAENLDRTRVDAATRIGAGCASEHECC